MRSTAPVALAEVVAVAETPRTACAADVVLDVVTTMEAAATNVNAVAAVALTVTTVLAVAFTAPSKP